MAARPCRRDFSEVDMAQLTACEKPKYNSGCDVDIADGDDVDDDIIGAEGNAFLLGKFNDASHFKSCST